MGDRAQQQGHLKAERVSSNLEGDVVDEHASTVAASGSKCRFQRRSSRDRSGLARFGHHHGHPDSNTVNLALPFLAPVATMRQCRHVAPWWAQSGRTWNFAESVLQAFCDLSA